MYNSIECMAFTRFNHRMDVVGHDAPSMEAVALFVEVKQCSFDQLCDFPSAKPTSTPAGVKPFISLSQIVGEHCQSLSNSLGQAVGQTKSHELDRLRCVEVR
jgi:hypothetical protein